MDAENGLFTKLSGQREALVSSPKEYKTHIPTFNVTIGFTYFEQAIKYKSYYNTVQ